MDKRISKETVDRSSKEATVKQISDYFREKIKNGVLAAGSVLPSIRELSEQLEIDLHEIRDAMDLLREEHLVKMRQGCNGGTIVLAENEWKRMAILLPDIGCWHWQSIHKEIDYFMKLNHWEVKLFTHEGKLELLEKHLSEISNGDYSGMIAAIPLSLIKEENQFAKIILSGFPVVFIGGGLNCWSVDDKLYACGYFGTKHLIEQKYKKIGIIACRSYDGTEFVGGCKQALEEAGMEDAATGYAEDEGFALKMLETWLGIEKRPDALFYQRSDHGEKCFDLLKSKRIQLGPDIGFITLDDTIFHKLTAPGPTAIRRFPERIGKKAVDLFLELVTLTKKQRLVAKRVDAEFRLDPGRSSQKGPMGRKIYRAVNPFPNLRDLLNSYYPPAPPMPPGYWDGY